MKFVDMALRMTAAIQKISRNLKYFQMPSQQSFHHLCLKLKHSFGSSHPRIFVQNTKHNKQIMDILLKEGFLVNIMPGDKRGPFCEMSEKQLSEDQKETLEVLRRTRTLIEKLHASMKSENANSMFKLSQDFNKFCEEQKKYRARPKQCREEEILSRIPVIPPISSVKLPSDEALHPLTMSVSTMEQLTPPTEQRLWCDLRYGLEGQPALTDMFIVSKGSRKIYTTAEDLRLVFTGKKSNNWKCGEVGAITFIETEKGIMTARDAVKQGLGGEVICVAK
jgi:ribosomal protein S8